MTKPEGARDADFEDASEKLNQGLKTCRAVVRNYRHMLAAEDSADQHALPSQEPPKSAG